MNRAQAVAPPALSAGHVERTQQPAIAIARTQFSNQLAQRQIAVNKPGDVFEQEAGQVADSIMAMGTAGTHKRSPVVHLQRKCAKCEEEMVQRKESASAGIASTGSRPARGPSQPLPPGVQSRFEHAFGHDFSSVRIHADEFMQQWQGAPVQRVTPRELTRAQHFRQTKLSVNTPGDRYEQEADRIAERVMRMPEPRVQRTCASCAGDSPCPKCEEEQKATLGQSMLQRKATGTASSHAASMVQQVLRSPAQPLDGAARSFLEPRFGSDLGHVKIHTGPEAAQSAQSLGALAYTVGSDLVFAQGTYSPGTSSGRRLLAHELVHTMQQGSEGQIRRFVPCRQASFSLQECPPRESGEVSASQTTPMALLTMSGPVNGYLIVNFAVDSSKVKSSLTDMLYWKQLVDLLSSPKATWNIWGLSDCQGSPADNERLRKDRAQAIYKILPPAAQKQIVSVEGAFIDDCMTANQSRPDRTVNRAVLIEQAGRTVDVDPKKEKPIEVTPPKFVCGPEVTQQVAAAVALAKDIFGKWSHSQKVDACNALIDRSVAKCSWDIVQLHNNKWIHQDYRPPCATQGATPPCGESVQMEGDCHHAGAVNYIIFGVMFKLCANSVDDDIFFDFTISNMKALIDIYKGSGISGFATPSKNFEGSLKWARAGYRGWPSGASTPSGDWNHCAPKCPKPYTGPAFKIHWYPHESNEVCSGGR